MNRQQAESILKAYLLIWSNPNMSDASEALRDVILDAMTEYRTSVSTTYPNITLPYTHVTNPTYKPVVTCSDPKVSVSL